MVVFPDPPELNLILSAPATLGPPAGQPNALRLADLDGDGRRDVVTENVGGSAFGVVRNLTPEGGELRSTTFAPLEAFGPATTLPGLAVADLDGDGRVDVVVNPAAEGVVWVFRNTSDPGDLRFANPLLLPNGFVGTAGVSTDVAVGDFDRDGRVDLAVVNASDRRVAVYRNTSTSGALSFAGKVEFEVALDPRRVAVGDLDGDGRPDLVVGHGAPAGLSLLRNTGAPGSVSFDAAGVHLPLTATPAELAVADLDRDGKPDVVAAVPTLDGVWVWRNTAYVGAFSATQPATLASPQWFETEPGPQALAVGEMDGDGLPEVAVLHFERASLTLLGNRSQPGQLELVPRGRFAAGDGPLAVALGDLNGDRRPDLAVADHLGGRLQVRQNRATQTGGGVVPFTIGNIQRPATDLKVTVRSANPGLLPPEGLVLGGEGNNRTLELTPLPGVSGVARITVRVENGAQGWIENELLVLVGCPGNTVWPTACELGWEPDAEGVWRASIHQALEASGEGRWFKFKIQPESELFIILSELPQDYDLFVFQDIQAAYEAIVGGDLVLDDLASLGTRYAPAAYSPAAYSGEAYAPVAYSPAAYSPAAYSPAAYSPAAYSPAAYSPAAYSPAAYSPAAYSPAAYSEDAFAPAAYSPAAYSGPAEAPVAFSPAAYSGAQTRSLVAVSAFDGLANEGIFMNTWGGTGDFYVCVRGRGGAFAPEQPFRLDLYLVPGDCGSLDLSALPASDTVATAGPDGGYTTLVLTDFARLSRPEDPATADAWAAEVALLRTRLDAFVARPEIHGVVVDLDQDAAIRQANGLADANYDCVFAKNVVARLIREVVERFRQVNPGLRYLVLVGGDDVIPNFRYPDLVPLGLEQNFIVPVRDATASQASLRLGYYLSQDAYGAPCEVEQKFTRVPLPQIAVGRLVESPADMLGLLEAYEELETGQLPLPRSSLVTGYEFLADAARAVAAELRAGIGEGAGQVHDTLIAPEHVSPQADPVTTENWSAAELAQVLFGRRHDLLFLAGHFNDGGALAADYVSQLTARQVAESDMTFQHSVIFGAGCHVGYNTVDRHAVPQVTQDPDWAQAFVRKRAILVGGMGYQYGDTEFLEYSERLYLNFAQQLRSGPPGSFVTLGEALVKAKRQYLNETDELRGLHEKVVLQVALFGLPMLKLHLPGKRPPEAGLEAIVSTLNEYPGEDPGDPGFAPTAGAVLGLKWADVTVDAGPLAVETRALRQYPEEDPANPLEVFATYLRGPQGNVSHPAEPVLPRVVKDVTAPLPGVVLRGVGFRGGAYADEGGVRPLTGAPATEFRGAVVAFESAVFHPVQPWAVNYFDSLCSGAGGMTRLSVFPAQYRTDLQAPETGTRRAFSDLRFRLFYSGNVATYTDALGANPDTPALADAPAIVEVFDEVVGGLVEVSARVVGNPAAGIQEVWVTYTAELGPWRGRWQVLDLAQDPAQSSLWSGTLRLDGDTEPAAVRYAVHAVNGVGLVTMQANRGGFFTPGAAQVPALATELTLDGFPLSGAHGDTAVLSAVLRSAEGAVAGQPVRFGLGSQQTLALTDADGRATVRLPLRGLPAVYALQVGFAGAPGLAPGSASTRFEILRQGTRIELVDQTTDRPNLNVTARLRDSRDRQLAEKSVFFVLTDREGIVRVARAAITDYAGQAPLGIVPLEAGTYTLRAFFNQRVPLPGEVSPVPPELVGTLQLDPRYLAAEQRGEFTFALVAAPATIFRQPGRLAKAHVPALLAASQGLAGSLALASVQDAAPEGAQVSVEETGDWILYEPPAGQDVPGGFTYTIADGQGNTATGTVDVILLPGDNLPTLNIVAIVASPGSASVLTVAGIPGLEYTIQAKASLETAVPWTTLGRVMAGANGLFQFTDTDAPNHGVRYYRAVGP